MKAREGNPGMHRTKRRQRFGVTFAVAPVLAALLVALLSGCVAGIPAPVPTYTPSSSASSSATPTPRPTGTAVPGPGAILRPGGTAAQNQQFFDFVASSLFATSGFIDGETIVNTLVAAGFDKAAMEITYDSTAIGLRADSVIFSVRFSDRCLLG
ncbi:MAG: hypothetical protein LH471_03475, partial [Salinibacterium sp.]|nr:hypothetical protein [Salinibacterium sp.]